MVSIDYSANGGRSWRTVFLSPNSGHVLLPALDSTASRNARIRVRVIDAFDLEGTVSPRFTVVGAPPRVTILSSFSRRMKLDGAAKLPLQGLAFDQAHKQLTGNSLRWFDGPFAIGTGSSISAGPLPAGANHIRLVARDPAGRTASTAITVNIGHVTLPFVTLAVPAHARRHARTLTLHASATVPATVTIARHKFHLVRKRRRYRLEITPGRAPILLHVSVSANGITTPSRLRSPVAEPNSRSRASTRRAGTSS